MNSVMSSRITIVYLLMVLKKVSSNPGSNAAVQQPWASGLHPIASAQSLQHTEVKLVSKGDNGDIIT